MSKPSVVAVMLVNGREGMVRRAVESFKAQTYTNKRLLIWDTGELNCDFDNSEDGDGSIVHMPAEAYRDPAPTIGALRNEANAFWNTHDIVCHWDSDDWSHPRRIEEQVALLEASGKVCVGYRDMLFWNQTAGQLCGAWLYRHLLKPLGTSLCYWRRAWEQRPFEDLPKAKGGTGEDSRWLEGVQSLSISSLHVPEVHAELVDATRGGLFGGPVDTYRRFLPGPLEIRDGQAIEPRMIASIHAGNTSYYGSDLLQESTSWRRAPEWDEHARKAGFKILEGGKGNPYC
jgi:hypothetical protein